MTKKKTSNELTFINMLVLIIKTVATVKQTAYFMFIAETSSVIVMRGTSTLKYFRVRLQIFIQ